MWIYLAYTRSTSPLKMIAAMVVIGMLTSVSIIGILKANSVHACPWSIIEVSGTGVDWLKPVNGLGRCFPGGHASAGFSLFILYFAYRLEYPKLARLALVFALFMGTMMSMTQMLRLAHSLSHNLWALWWSWCVDVLVYKAFMLSIFAKSSKVQAQNSKLA